MPRTSQNSRLALGCLALLMMPHSMATSLAPTSVPSVDFNRMGSVALGGAFIGLDWFTSTSPFAISSTSIDSSFSHLGDTLVAYQPDGTLTILGATNAGGTINSICWSNFSVPPTSSSSNGTLFIGGAFSSLGSVSSPNIVAYSLASSNFFALSSGLSGPVDSLYCDNAHDEVWIGGSFSAPVGSGGNVALWSVNSTDWSEVMFGGLNNRVDTIVPSKNGSSLYFGGQFTTTFTANSSSNANNSSIGVTSVPSSPVNTTTTGMSGYLTPFNIPLSSSPFGGLTIDAAPATSQAAYNNPSVLICPGSGTWLARDGSVATIDILSNGFLSGTGVRVANGLIEGRGTTSFCVTTLPDNTLLNMTYSDPTTGVNMTCQWNCPLSTDSSVAAQDFIFTDGPRNMTGLHIVLDTWEGAGSSLDYIQLLSTGAYASAVSEENKSPCNITTNPSVDTVGVWTTESTPTSIPGTTSYYLSSTVPITGVTSSSLTVYPVVSSSAYYDIYLIIPGCAQIGDCLGRTSVDIVVFPVEGGLGWTSTISEQVQSDTAVLIYSGLVDATSESFSPTVRLALAASPEPVAGGDDYVIVADGVQMVLTGLALSNGTSTNSTVPSSDVPAILANSTTGPNETFDQVSYGVFEWVRSSTFPVNASSQLSNTSETTITQLGFVFDVAYNAMNSSESWAINAIATLEDLVFVGGSFSSGDNYTNVVSVNVTTGLILPLQSQGLNDIVNTIAVVDDYAYFGGEFSATTSAANITLDHVARYNPGNGAWSALGGGVDGNVTAIVPSSLSASQLIVIGNFSNVIAANGSATATGGYAIYDTISEEWLTVGLIYGDVSAASAPFNATTFLAGRIYGSSSNPVNGVATLATNSDGTATISSINGVIFSTNGSSSSLITTTSRRSMAADWFTRLTNVMESVNLSPRTTSPSIETSLVDAPAVLAGAFWTNSSASDSEIVTILGGNFTSTSGVTDIEGVAFYSSLRGMTGPTPPVSGVVRAIDVVDNHVYIGGTNLDVSGIGTGLVVYNLATGSWIAGGMPALGGSGSDLSVYAIKTRYNSNTIIAAGNFATAGSLSCPVICLWDSDQAQWSMPGTGLVSGEVRSMDFADDSYGTLVVGGSFVLPNGAAVYAASYHFANSSWSQLGFLPGPVLSIAVDDKNGSNIFAAGYSASDSTPFLQQWNGSGWTAQNSSILLNGTVIQQLAFVPMTSEHTAVGAIENDRMLMVSGELYLQSIGNMTTALFDGTQWYPYLVGSTSSGALGSGSSLFWSESSFSFSISNFLARGLVVLIAMAIALGLIFLLILFILLIAYFIRRKERKVQPHDLFEKPGSEVSSTHHNVLNGVQSTLEQSLAGAAFPRSVVNIGAPTEGANESADAVEGTDQIADDQSEEDGRETSMRFDFVGADLQSGELAMRAGQRIIILDDEQSDEWWYARDPTTGKEGVVPATYVW